MAPEVLDPDPDCPIGGASDQYALAVTLHESIAGRRPFDSTNVIKLYRQTQEGCAPLTESFPNIPVAASEAVARALSADFTQRFLSCRSFADAFLNGLCNKAESTPVIATPRKSIEKDNEGTREFDREQYRQELEKHAGAKGNKKSGRLFPEAPPQSIQANESLPEIGRAISPMKYLLFFIAAIVGSTLLALLHYYGFENEEMNWAVLPPICCAVLGGFLALTFCRKHFEVPLVFSVLLGTGMTVTRIIHDALSQVDPSADPETISFYDSHPIISELIYYGTLAIVPLIGMTIYSFIRAKDCRIPIFITVPAVAICGIGFNILYSIVGLEVSSEVTTNSWAWLPLSWEGACLGALVSAVTFFQMISKKKVANRGREISSHSNA